jgi:hypothetical protein
MKTYSPAEYNREVEAQTKAARKAADLRAAAEREAEDLRRKQISAIGREYGILQAANEAICDDLSVEAFRNSAVIEQLESQRDALQAAVDSGTRAPARGALHGGIPGKEDRLLDALSEAQKRNDPSAKYRAIAALRKNRETSE